MAQRNHLTPVHAKLAPIRCTPAGLADEEDDGEPVFLRCAELQRLDVSDRSAFGRPAVAVSDECDRSGRTSGVTGHTLRKLAVDGGQPENVCVQVRGW
jgi:hypothetical protein